MAKADYDPNRRELLLFVPPEGELLGPSTDLRLGLLPLGSSEAPRMLLEGPGSHVGGEVSPDGRWLLYTHERDDTSRVFLTRFPEPRGRWQVSVGTGSRARWDPRGDRLYFLGENDLMEVTLAGDSEPRLGTPEPLFPLRYLSGARNYLPSEDGERFLVIVPTESTEETVDRSGIKVVERWRQEFP